ncbi:matrixin family metalloprotease [Chloroflexota bacterium]
MKKALIGILVSSILMLGLLPSAVAAAPDRKPITPPEIKGITFIHYAKPDVPPGQLKKEEPVEVDNSYYELLDLHLAGTVSYYINPSGAPGGAVDEIIQSFETWDVVTGTELFSFTEQTSVYGLNYDEQNTVSWQGIVPPSTIAVTRLWYNGSTGEIIEFDIVFNSLLKWGIDPDGEGPKKLKRAYDVENIATHEVGHVVGLDDLYEEQYRELTMYGYGRKGEVIKISLEEGDIAGAQYLYGSP